MSGSDGSSVDNYYSTELAGYLNPTVLTVEQQFVCSHGSDCERSAAAKDYGFAAGQLSFVGANYGSSPTLRVVVVSMQVGDAEAPVSMARRAEQIQERVEERPGQRNPHMRGVTRALQVLHGLSLDPAEEHLGDGTHVLDTYAMLNSVLCSALPTGGRSRRGRPTDTMVQNCSHHLRESLRLLEPSIILTQGVDPAAAVKSLATVEKELSGEVSIISVAGQRTVLCALSHPAAGPPKSWSSMKPGSYFDTVVVPSLIAARAAVQ